MDKVINLTGHDVTIKSKSGDIVIPAIEERVKARYETHELKILKTKYGDIPLTKNFYHISKRLPPEEPNTYYIVSKIAAEVNPLRNDLVIINGLIRDGYKPIGCKSLAKI